MTQYSLSGILDSEEMGINIRMTEFLNPLIPDK